MACWTLKVFMFFYSFKLKTLQRQQKLIFPVFLGLVVCQRGLQSQHRPQRPRTHTEALRATLLAAPRQKSFFKSLKNERMHQARYATRNEAKRDTFEYIEALYIRRRHHSSLGYQSPAGYHAARLSRQKLAAWTLRWYPVYRGTSSQVPALVPGTFFRRL